MRKKVWIFNHYAAEMLINEGGRHYWFAKYLKKSGYEPVVFTCNVMHYNGGNYYNSDNLWHEHSAPDGFPFVMIRSTPYQGNGKSRVKNMLVFAKNLAITAKQYAKKYGKPDIIYASSAHPFTVLVGEQLAKQMRIPCICEVRDLWPESIFAYYPEKKNKLLAKALYAGEMWMYKKADAIIFTMEGGRQYIIDRKGDIDNGGSIGLGKVHWLCNGIDYDGRRLMQSKYSIQDKDLEDESSFKVCYIGSVRKANNVESIVQCADKMRDTNVMFLVYGDGDEKAKLEALCKENSIDNIKFKGTIGKQYIPYILSKVNLTLLNYQSAPGTLRYGGSQNKLFEYFAAGRPVISNITMGYDLISRYECGVSKDIKTPEEYAEAISSFIQMDKDDYENMCDNALKAAKAFDFKEMTNTLIEIIEGIP